METIVVATIKEWNINNFYKLQEKYKNQYKLILIEDKKNLTYDKLFLLQPKYIFFAHWSWLIQDKIYKNFECIVFHMTDLPFGRGGSPLQNLLQRQIYTTKISALKVDGEVDNGDIYLKENFDISNGSAHELYIKASNIIFEKMIPTLLKENIIPKKQNGEVTIFKRRTPKDSDILSSQVKNIQQLYDFIRMLDAPSYPKANITFGKLKIELKDVKIKAGKLSGNFEVIEDE